MWGDLFGQPRHPQQNVTQGLNDHEPTTTATS